MVRRHTPTAAGVCCAAALAALWLAAACTQEVLTPASQGLAETGPVTVEAVFAETVAEARGEGAAETRTTLEGLSPVWMDGDRISFFGASGTNGELTLTAREGGRAVFTGTADLQGPYVAVYPYSADNALKGKNIEIEVPGEQRLAGSVVAPGAMLTVASGTGTDMRFRNVCGLLKLTVSDEGVTAVTVRTQDGSPLAGRVSVNPDSGVIMSVEKGSDQVTLRPEGKTFAPGTYYIAAIPGEKKGITVDLSRTADARKGAKSSGNVLKLARSSAVSLGTFRTTGLEWEYRIGNYADLLAWKDDKAHWDPEGETVRLTGNIDMQDEPWTPLTDSYPGELLGGGHCISHINIQSAASAHLGFFGKGYAKEIHDLVLGSEDGETYDGTSCIISSYNTTSTSSYWSYTAPVTLPGADIYNLTNFIPVTVKAGSNRSSRAGGIAAWVTEKVNITGCVNHGPVTVEAHAITEGSSYKYLAAAGILGGLNTATGEVSLSDCHNYAAVRSTNPGSMGLGGIVGFVYTTIKDLTVDNCTNDGDIELLYTATQNDYFAIGGIVGKPGCPAGGTPNAVRNCVNRGHIYSEAVHQHYVGGIAGRADGVDIAACRNEGTVEINHDKQASTRFQTIGGILGGAQSAGGGNILRDNVNAGTVIMKVASSGHNKTPSSSTTFYGVDAGGIVGLAGSISILEGNRHEGTVRAENGFSATNAAYPATLYAGGIVGFDFGTLERCADNVSTGTVSARTTKATQVPSEVCAGGIAGKIRAATLLSGSGTGSVSAEAADVFGTALAGSVAGYNGGTIITCSYGGTVKGAPADESNIVGGGNQPLSIGEDPGTGGVFSVSETEVVFPGGHFTQTLLRVSTADKPVRLAFEDLDWLKTGSLPAEIPAGRAVTLSLLPRTGNVCETREGILRFSEEGGETKTVRLRQDNLYTPVDGFPARWEIVKGVTYTPGNAAGLRWLNEGVAETVSEPSSPSNAPGTGYISAGSTTGNTLVYSVAPGGTQNISIGNMGEGDYIQFSVPVTTLPAGTDVDFMVTINTNNNKTPKYWLFEYWDAGEWKAQPRYTATEDGKTRYSLDVYDYDSKNHRTYITTFTLSQAISGDFVKMRLRAVGPFNCNGEKLLPTANAFMNFPCTEYRSCEIAAYPGVSAEKTPKKILQLGNSFTYYHGSAFKLKQICRAEGHATDVRINVKGSQEFEHHLDLLPFSQRLVAEGGYDAVILQDGSYFHAEYGAGSASAIQGVTPKYTPEEILALTKRMTAAVKAASPGAEIILESTWSYPYKSLGNFLGFGSYAGFDEMLWKGSTALADEDKDINWLSPIGKAFAKARNEYGFTSAYNYLLYTDNYHPHRYGAYLKACVNYLLLYGQPFGDHPADCDVPPAEAAKLRAAAEAVVLGPGRETYHIR